MKKRRPIFTKAQTLAFAKKHARFWCINCNREWHNVPGWVGNRPVSPPLYSWAEINMDHHLSLVDGGKHELANWVPRCIPCHKEKSAREHIANCKAKRLANPKPSKHSMPKTGRKMQSHVNSWGRK